ncbi:DUF3040 domain-containing protein [Kitasatospora sp. NPDC051914]|uniref:DUF3040 domain-containing protein n=1 Tax=Kitasatospora sp. NPDC051914 TaxID=3154945 RepID=UPI00342DCEA2
MAAVAMTPWERSVLADIEEQARLEDPGLDRRLRSGRGRAGLLLRGPRVPTAVVTALAAAAGLARWAVAGNPAAAPLAGAAALGSAAAFRRSGRFGSGC